MSKFYIEKQYGKPTIVEISEEEYNHLIIWSENHFSLDGETLVYTKLGKKTVIDTFDDENDAAITLFRKQEEEYLAKDDTPMYFDNIMEAQKSLENDW